MPFPSFGFVGALYVVLGLFYVGLFAGDDGTNAVLLQRMSRTSTNTFFLWENERRIGAYKEEQKQSIGERACDEFPKQFCMRVEQTGTQDSSADSKRR